MATSRTALDESSSTIEFNDFLAIITEDVSGRRAIMMIENLGFFSALERTPGLLASLEYFLSRGRERPVLPQSSVGRIWGCSMY